MRNKNKDIFFVMNIEHRHEDSTGFEHVKFHLQVDRLSNIKSIHHVPRLGLRPDSPQAHDFIARRLRRIEPFGPRLDLTCMKVVINDAMCIALLDHFSFVQENRPLAHSCDGPHIVRNQNHGATMLPDVFHLAHAFFLETDVPDGQHFIHNEDVRIHMGQNGKAQPTYIPLE